MATNRDINERRRQRLGMASGEEPKALPSLARRQRMAGYARIQVPPRDLAPVANYSSEMWRIVQRELKGRSDILAIEVGSRRGHFAAGFLENVPGSRIFCVDHWAGRMGQGNLEVWLKRLGPYLFERAFPLRGTSGAWSGCFPFGADLLFIDAEHDYKNVLYDLRCWWPFLNEGGLLMGHDYHQDGVKRAADEFLAEQGREISTAKLGPQHAVTFWTKR